MVRQDRRGCVNSPTVQRRRYPSPPWTESWWRAAVFESSFQFRSATLYGTFEPIEESDKVRYLETLTDTFIPGRVAELRASSRKELAATMALRMPITDQKTGH